MGVGPKPMSMLFERRTTEDTVTGRPEPYLHYIGASSFTARDVLDKAKTDDRDSNDAAKGAQAAWWITRTLDNKGPMPTKDLVSLAKADGTYYSRNTFDRARKFIGVIAYQPEPGGPWWVRLPSQPPTGSR
jgi:hypothetical protein